MVIIDEDEKEQDNSGQTDESQAEDMAGLGDELTKREERKEGVHDRTSS